MMQNDYQCLNIKPTGDRLTNYNSRTKLNQSSENINHFKTDENNENNENNENHSPPKNQSFSRNSFIRIKVGGERFSLPREWLTEENRQGNAVREFFATMLRWNKEMHFAPNIEKEEEEEDIGSDRNPIIFSMLVLPYLATGRLPSLSQSMKYSALSHLSSIKDIKDELSFYNIPCQLAFNLQEQACGKLWQDADRIAEQILSRASEVAAKGYFRMEVLIKKKKPNQNLVNAYLREILEERHGLSVKWSSGLQNEIVDVFWSKDMESTLVSSITTLYIT